jgi:hypothetical protein
MSNPYAPPAPEPSTPRGAVVVALATLWVPTLLFASWSLGHVDDAPVRSGWGVAGFALLPVSGALVASLGFTLVVLAKRVPIRAEPVELAADAAPAAPPTTLSRVVFVDPWLELPRALGARAAVEASLRASLPDPMTVLAPGTVETMRLFALWTVGNQLALPLALAADGALVTGAWQAAVFGLVVGGAVGLALRFVGVVRLVRAIGLPVLKKSGEA